MGVEGFGAARRRGPRQTPWHGQGDPATDAIIPKLRVLYLQSRRHRCELGHNFGRHLGLGGSQKRSERRLLVGGSLQATYVAAVPGVVAGAITSALHEEVTASRGGLRVVHGPPRAVWPLGPRRTADAVPRLQVQRLRRRVVEAVSDKEGRLGVLGLSREDQAAGTAREGLTMAGKGDAPMRAACLLETLWRVV